MSLFGDLYIGDSGLRTSQNALNTVAHNLSNLNTPGYVRQQVANTDTTYTNTTGNRNLRVGDGVKYAECRHVRDAFLDATYREEKGRYDYYEKSYAAMTEIEDILGELDGAAFKGSLEGLWTSIQQLSTSPNDNTYISLFVSKAATFMENATSVYSSFIELQDNLNRQVVNAVKEINSIGKQIHALNKQISKIETAGVEKANDLRDKRDLLIDELAGYGNISYEEQPNGMVTVRFNHNDFVTQSGAYEMGMLVDEETGYSTPYWKQNVRYTTNEKGVRVPDYTSAQVFDLTEEISTKRDTDVGSLRALLLARGDHAANYTDLDVNACTERKLKALGITREQYNEKAGLEYYNKYIANSSVMNIMAEFDNIVHSVTTAVNEVLFNAAKMNPASGYLLNENGSPMQLFVKSDSPGYEKVVLTAQQEKELKDQGAKLMEVYDENGKIVEHTFWKYIEEEPDSPYSLYNCMNLKINDKLVQMPSLLKFKWEEDSVDYNIGTDLIKKFQESSLYLNPNATAKSTFESCYTDLVAQVSNTGYVMHQLSEFQQLAVENADNERQTVIGVSSDEELEHMIMYQNAYNAASRYITVVNDMLDTLLSVGA